MSKIYSLRLLPGVLMVILMIASCRNDKNPPDETLTEAVEKSERIPARDNTAVDSAYIADAGTLNRRNPRWYTYRYNDGSTLTSENPIVRSNNRAEATGSTADAMYEISETSRPPLFDKNCLTAAKPEQCSNEAVLDWMQYAVERPAVSAEQKQQIIHYVSFTIDKIGKVALDKIIPAGKRCEPCEAATKEAITGMPDWMPAIRNTQPVTVRVMLPVYYD